jgi:hypothetical protein
MANTPAAASVAGGAGSIYSKEVRAGRRVVVMTDRRILVFQGSLWRNGTLKRLVRELPRHIPIECQPVRRTNSATTESFGEPLIVHALRFSEEIDRAGL